MLTSDSFSAWNTYHTASDELDSAGWRGSIHSTQRHAQYYVGSMMDHLGCKSMTWPTPIDRNVSFLSVQISLASQVANYLENSFILFWKSKYIATNPHRSIQNAAGALQLFWWWSSAPRTADSLRPFCCPKCTHKKKKKTHKLGYNGSPLLREMFYLVQKYIIIENNCVLGD